MMKTEFIYIIIITYILTMIIDDWYLVSFLRLILYYTKHLLYTRVYL